MPAKEIDFCCTAAQQLAPADQSSDQSSCPRFARSLWLAAELGCSLAAVYLNMKATRFLRLTIYCIMVLLSCSKSAPYVVKRLPSGKDIKVLSIGKLYFTQDTPALVLNYLTDIDIDDHKTLEKEADEIWIVFKVDVEHAGLRNAVVSAHAPATGSFIKTDTGYNFVYQKRDGIWRRVS